MKIFRLSDIKTTVWSGGETRELFIYPANASFQERNFLLRISSASVKTDSSEFTKFQGFQRLILPLDGTLTLNHNLENGVLEQELQPLELGVFSGDWQTSSKGKVQDFNVIYNPSISPKLSLIDLHENNTRSNHAAVKVIVVVEGNIDVEGIVLGPYEGVILDKEAEEVVLSTKSARLIEVEF